MSRQHCSSHRFTGSNALELGILLSTLFKTPVIEALTSEGGLHSDMLQDYLVDIGYQSYIQSGDIVFGEKQPQGRDPSGTVGSEQG